MELGGVLYFVDKQMIWSCPKKKKNPTAFDLEYLKQMLDRRAERKDEGSRRKDRPTSRQEDHK